MKIEKCLCLCLLCSLFLASCATVQENLQGIPQGLTSQDRQTIAQGQLATTLQVANDLEARYQTARDDNLRYAYWSNVAFIPAAMVAAGAIAFNAYKDLLAGVGIAAGGLAGFNTFVNARNNAKIYQSGMNGLDCITTKLSPYVNAKAESLQRTTDNLESALVEAQIALALDQSFKFNTKNEIAEIRNNPLAVTSLAGAEKVASQAISDAQKALSDAQTEIALYSSAPFFAADGIRKVNVLVSSKISQSDVNYSSLLTSISGLTKAPTPAPKAAAPAAAAPAAAAPPSATPIADATAMTLDLAQKLAKQTAALIAATQQSGLAAQEKAVTDCLTTVGS
jgi:hypothetical protein